MKLKVWTPCKGLRLETVVSLLLNVSRKDFEDSISSQSLLGKKNSTDIIIIIVTSKHVVLN